VSDLKQHATKTNWHFWEGPEGDGSLKRRLARNRRRAEPRIIAEQLADHGDGMWSIEDDHDYNCVSCGGDVCLEWWAT
jgi:hypothetical protein